MLSCHQTKTETFLGFVPEEESETRTFLENFPSVSGDDVFVMQNWPEMHCESWKSLAWQDDVGSVSLPQAGMDLLTKSVQVVTPETPTTSPGVF
jgi:hypothetical protein